MTSRALKLAAVRELAASGRARAIRIRARLSLDEVGLEVDRTAATISRWENGGRPHGDAALAWGDLMWALERDLAGTTVLASLAPANNPDTASRQRSARSVLVGAGPPEAA